MKLLMAKSVFLNRDSPPGEWLPQVWLNASGNVIGYSPWPQPYSGYIDEETPSHIFRPGEEITVPVLAVAVPVGPGVTEIALWAGVE